MNKALALAFGIATLVAAFYLALHTSEQQPSAQAELGQKFATALHQTPTPTPTPTITPTAIHLTSRLATDREIERLLAQSSDRGVSLCITEPVVLTRLDARARGNELLIVSGSNMLATNGRWEIPAAFGAILVWQGDEYRMGFLRIEHGDTTARVESVLLENGTVIFHFYDMGRSGRDDLQAQRSVIVAPCRISFDVTVVWGSAQQAGPRRSDDCF